ncbi:MAG: MMPL family transporter [Nannocystaceae bacterium]|nr:MMPL family transporter [Nannocystaceae bacterium]
MTARFAALAQLLLRHRRIAAIAWLLLLGFALAGAARLRFDLSSKAFYGDGDAATAALEALQARWGHDDATLVVVADAPDEAGVLTHARLHAIRALADELRARDEVERVDTVTDHPASAAVAGGSRPARAWLHSAPIVPVLLAADERSAAIAVRLRFSSDALEPTVAAVEALQAVIGAHDGDAGLRLYAGGLPAVRAAFARTSLADQRVLVPVCLVVVSLVLSLALRRAWQVVVPLLLALVPTVVLLGLMGWAGVPIGLLNQGYFTLLPVIALADGVHLVTRVAEHGASALDRDARDGAIATGCGRVGLSCLLTSSTTAIGFASLALSGMPMLRSFGGWAALGVMLAFATLLLLAPLLLAPVRDLGPGTALVGDERHWLARATAFARTRPWPTLLLAITLTAVAVLAARRVPIDNRLSDLVDADHPASRASAAIDARLGGVLSLELELVGPAGHWRAPEHVRALAELEDAIATLPQVRAVIGPTVMLRAAGSRVADDEAGIVRGWRRLDAAGLRRDVLDDDEGIAHVSVRVPDLGGRSFEALVATITDRTHALAGVTVHAGGTAALAYRGVNRIATELRDSILGAFAVITIAIGVALRSARAGLAAIVPNAVPLLLGYAAFALWLDHFDPLGGVILAVALGIAVDDTIHLLARTREHLHQGHATAHALTLAVAGAGLPCAVTSVVLAAGLASFTLSSFPPLRQLGALGALVIVVALVCDLLLLPAMVMVLRRRDRPPRG